MKKFCFNCGAKLDENAVFCAECGAKIEEGEVTTTPTNSNDTSVPPPTPPNEVVSNNKSRDKSWYAWSLLGMGLILSNKGRINRQDFILGYIALSIVIPILNTIFEFLLDADILGKNSTAIVWYLTSMIPIILESCLIRERLNDMNLNGRVLCFFYLIPWVFMRCLADAYNYLPNSNMWSHFFSSVEQFFLAIMVVGGISFLVVIILCCIKGTDGPNQYGEDPLSKKSKIISR